MRSYLGQQQDSMLKFVENEILVLPLEEMQLEEVKIYIFYFSMMHCPPCREFTPLLSQLYNAQITKHWEVIFFSCDLKQDNFDAYLQKMPWFAMPFRDKRLRSVALEFGVKEVP